MASYGSWDVLLGFLACPATAWACVSLVLHWQSLFEKVRESCRAGVVHPARRLLLWLVALTHLVWVLAVVLYLRNLVALWGLMARILKEDLSGRVAYTFVDICLLLIILCGLCGVAFTVLFVHSYWEEAKTLFMIIRFSGNNHNTITDLEDQRGPSRNHDPVSNLERRRVLTEDFSAMNSPHALGYADTVYDRRAAQDTYHRAHRRRHYDPVSRVSAISLDPPIAPRNCSEPNRTLRVRNPDSFGEPSLTDSQALALCDRYLTRSSSPVGPVKFPNFDKFENTIESSSSNSADGNGGDTTSLEFDPMYDVSPRPVSSLAFDDDAAESELPGPTNVEQPTRSRCYSCSSEHALTIPTTRRAAVREPLSATSPTGPSVAHVPSTGKERQQGKSGGPTRRVLSGVAQPCVRVEPTKSALSERASMHASIQQPSESIITNTRNIPAAIGTIGHDRPFYARPTQSEHTDVDKASFSDTRSLHEAVQRTSLDQEKTHHLAAAQEWQEMAKEAEQDSHTLSKLRIARLQRRNKPYLQNAYHLMDDRNRLPSANRPPPGSLRLTSRDAQGLKSQHAIQNRSCRPPSQLPPRINEPATPVDADLGGFLPLTRVESWRRDVPRRNLPQLSLAIPEPEQGVIEEKNLSIQPNKEVTQPFIGNGPIRKWIIHNP